MIILDTRFIPACKLCGGEAALQLPDFPIEEDQADIRVVCGQCGAVGPAIVFDLSVHDNNDLPGLQIEALSAWCNNPPESPAAPQIIGGHPIDDPIKIALVEEIISAYHTTRMAGVPAALHILSKPKVQEAFTAFSAKRAEG